MISCNECLAALSTSRLSDIRSGSPVATHYSTCDACLRIVQDLQYAENGLATVLDNFGPRATPLALARNATDLTLRRRRRIARVVRATLALIAVGVSAAALEAFVEDDDYTVTEIVSLTCLSSERALEISQQFIGTGATVTSSVGEERTIRLQGEELDVAEAAARIAVADNAASCQNPSLEDAAGVQPTPPDDKAGKD